MHNYQTDQWSKPREHNTTHGAAEVLALASHQLQFHHAERDSLGGRQSWMGCFAELAEAATIYEQYRNHHGLGSVHLNYGYLHLDNGDLELADTEAKTAFRLGEEKHDYILMARARLLQLGHDALDQVPWHGAVEVPPHHLAAAHDLLELHGLRLL